MGSFYRGWMIVALLALSGPVLATTPATAPAMGAHGVYQWPVEPMMCVPAHPKAITDIAFLPDGKQVVTVGHDNAARIWDVASGRLVKEFIAAPANIWKVAVSPDGKTFATGDRGPTVRIWDIASGEVVQTFEAMGNGVQSLRFRKDGKLIAGGLDGYVIRDVANDRYMYKSDSSFRDSTGFETCVNGRFAACFAMTPAGRRVHVYDLDRQKLLAELPATQPPMRNYQLSIAPDGKRVFGWIAREGVREEETFGWDVETGKPLDLTHQQRLARRIDFSPDGTRALILARSHTIGLTSHAILVSISPEQIWQPLMVFGTERPGGLHAECGAISPDGTVLATGSGFRSNGLTRVSPPGHLYFYRISDQPVKPHAVAGAPVGPISWEATPVQYKPLNGAPRPLHQISRRGSLFADTHALPKVRRLADKLDVVWWIDTIALLRQPGLMEEIVYTPGERFTDLAFDGKYIWAASTLSGLSVFTLDGKKVDVVGAEAALPPARADLRIAALSPGRIVAVGGDVKESPRNGPIAAPGAGWCSVVHLELAADGSGTFIPEPLFTEAELPAEWPTAQQNLPMSVMRPHWMAAEPDAAGKTKAVWIGFIAIQQATPFIRIDAERLTWTAITNPTIVAGPLPPGADGAFARTPSRLVITNPPLFAKGAWFVNAGSSVLKIQPKLDGDREWTVTTGLGDILWPSTRTGEVVLIESMMYLTGETWLKLDAATEKFSKLGPGLRIDGDLVSEDVTYFSSGHAHVAALSMLNGTFFAISTDPAKPAAVRATAQRPAPYEPEPDIVMRRETNVDFIGGEEVVAFMDGKLINTSRLNLHRTHAMNGRTEVLRRLDPAIDRLRATPTQIGLSAEQKTDLSALRKTRTFVQFTPEQKQKFSDLYATYEAAPFGTEESKKAAAPIFEELRASGQKLRANQDTYVIGLRGLLTQTQWKQVREWDPGLLEQMEAYFPVLQTSRQ